MKFSKSGINIHLYPSNFLHESRIEKIATALRVNEIFKSIWLIGVAEGRLPRRETFGDGIDIIRVGRQTMRRSIVVKLVAFLQYYLDVIYLLRKETIACVNAHSISVLPLAIFLRWYKGCTVIYDTHELETETHSLKGIRQQFAKLVERIFIKNVQAIICVSEDISNWYQNTYSISPPTTILNAPVSSPFVYSNFLRASLNLGASQKIVLYLGMLEPGRGVELLINAFAERTDSSIVMVFVGFGSLAGEINRSEAFGRTIFYHPPVPVSKIQEVASSADFGVCLVSPTCLSYTYCMPNKLFEYLTSGLPVLVSPCISLQNFVTLNKIGFVLSDMQPESVTLMIDRIANEDLSEMRLKARAVALENCWDVQAKTLINVYKGLFYE